MLLKTFVSLASIDSSDKKEITSGIDNEVIKKYSVSVHVYCYST